MDGGRLKSTQCALRDSRSNMNIFYVKNILLRNINFQPIQTKCNTLLSEVLTHLASQNHSKLPVQSESTPDEVKWHQRF